MKSDKVCIPGKTVIPSSTETFFLAGGYAIEHDGLCTTVFSAPNYVDQSGNKGAFVRIDAHGEREYTVSAGALYFCNLCIDLCSRLMMRCHILQ
jgi:hypothetical protein